MPKSNNEPITPPVSATKVKRKSNVSLPERESPHEVLPTVSRRNTLIEEVVSKPRKKPKPPSTPTIPEDETTDQIRNVTTFVIDNEVQKLNRSASDASRISTASSKNPKVSYTYENKAYDGTVKPSGSRNNSIRTTSRAPSVQSLEVYREQYCCCAKRTKCERVLLVAVTVLVVIIIVLVIIVIVLATHDKLNSLI